MVYRIFVEKKEGLDNEARGLLSEAKNLLGIENLTAIRLFNRYDAENIEKELFDYSIKTVFSEPQLDLTYSELSLDGALVFAVEPLPGQFDQRADSAAQCIQIISKGVSHKLVADSETQCNCMSRCICLTGVQTDVSIVDSTVATISTVQCSTKSKSEKRLRLSAKTRSNIYY